MLAVKARIMVLSMNRFLTTPPKWFIPCFQFRLGFEKFLYYIDEAYPLPFFIDFVIFSSSDYSFIQTFGNVPAYEKF